MCHAQYTLSLTSPAVSTGAYGHTFYASPSGTSNGDGSVSKPWDLATALGETGLIKAGDVLYLRGGVYRGSFDSYLKGATNNPVTIRSYPGEMATIDGRGSSNSTLKTYGAWSIFRDFEITNSDPDRSTVRPTGLYTLGADQKYIDLIIHDAGVGIASFGEALRAEIYGCIVYNNGYQAAAPDRGHGHGLYLQNGSTGTKIISHNVFFDNFGWGIHAYSEGAAGEGVLKDLYLESNISFNNGSLTREKYAYPNILVGGLIAASGIALTDNFTYQRPVANSLQSANVKLGYGSNSDVTFTVNHVTGGNPVLDLSNWTKIIAGGNTVSGDATLVSLSGTPATGQSALWVSNRYVGVAQQPFSTADWQILGADLGSSQSSAEPGAVSVFLRRNKYEIGRALIIISNPALAPGAEVDLSDLLSTGATYAIRDVQNLSAPPILKGVFSGASVYLSLTGGSSVDAVGLPGRAEPSGPRFRVFLVTLN
jgi:hypothetical protein